jgi:hypothetical protein
MWGPVVDAGLNHPFLLVNSQVHGRDYDPSWVRFWAALRGWRLNLQLAGSGHNSFNDLQILVPQLAGPAPVDPEPDHLPRRIRALGLVRTGRGSPGCMRPGSVC